MTNWQLMEFGALLRQYRLKSGVTLKKLTEVVSIDNTYLSKIENNLRSPPKRNIIIEIAKALDLNPVETDKLLLSASFAPIKSFYEENFLLADILYSQIRKKGMKAIYEIINRPMGGAIVIRNNKILVKQISTSPIKGVWAIPHGFVNPKEGDKTAEDIACRLIVKIFGQVKLKIVKELTREGEVLQNIDTTDYFMKLGLFPPIFKIYEIQIEKKAQIKSPNTLFIPFDDIINLPGLIHPLLYQIMQPYIKDPRIIKKLYERGQETIQKLTGKRSFYLDMKSFADKRISKISFPPVFHP